MLSGEWPEGCACAGCTLNAMRDAQVYRAGWRTPQKIRLCRPHAEQLDGQSLTAKRFRELFGRR